MNFSRRPGARFNRGRIATAATGSTAVSPPPVAGYAVWFDPDNPNVIAYNPNYRYPGHTEPGALGSTWSQATYNSRMKRDTVTCNSGALSRQMAWSNGAAARSLTYDGAKSTTRFMHDGTGGVTFYLVVTPRATDASSEFLFDSTTLTGVGFRLRTTAGTTQVRLTIGNGAATALDVSSTAGEFTTWLPHLITVTLHTYGGIGTLGATIRIDNGTPVTANWSAAPGAGDAAGTLTLGGTFSAHIGGVAIYNSLLTMGGANDLAVKSYFQTRFIGTPDPWQPPVWGQVIEEGDSIARGLGGTPTIEQLTLSRPFDYTNVATSGHTLIGDIDTAGNKTALNALYDSARPFNIILIDCGTNDVAASSTAVAIKAAMVDLVSALKGAHAWDCVHVCNIRNRSGFTAPMEAEAVAYNASLASDKAGADELTDARTLASTDTLQPTWWFDSIHPNTLGYAQLVSDFTTKLNAHVPAVVVPATYDYINNDGTTVGWIDMLDATSYTQAAGVLTSLKEKISNTAMTLAGSPAYEATGLYGHPAIHADGTNDSALTTAAALVAVFQGNANAYSIHALVRFDAADASGTILSAAINGASSLTMGQSSFSSGRYDTRLNGASTNGTTSTSFDLVVFTKVVNGTSTNFYVTTYFAATALDASSPLTIDPTAGFAPTRVGIMANVDAAFDTFLDGYVGEIVVKSTNNDLAAVTRIANAMLRRWS